MLMRFGVSNFRSLNQYQEFSLVASALKDAGTDLLQPSGVKEKLLPSALIYGANASGKSNILAAIRFLRGAILYSNKRQPTDEIPRAPFLLDAEARARPTQVDCDFVLNDTRYNFGFVASDDEFLEEWLFAFPDGNRRKWYHRKNGEKISFGKHFKGKNQAIAELTRRNVLFLTAAAQNAHVQATEIFSYFEAVWQETISPTLNLQALAEELSAGIDDRIVDFLRLADTGIKRAQVTNDPAPEELTNFFEKIKTLADSEFSAIRFEPKFAGAKLALAHYAGGEDDIFLDVKLESRGTLRLLKLLRPLFKVLDSGGVLFVDEIDSSIHTLLSQKLLSLFSSRATNPRGAQLIATTHDTNLLCSSFLRRDQIWFTEKDGSGATHVFPLSDIATRRTDNLEKGYLQGRFGALPFIGPIEKLLAGH